VCLWQVNYDQEPLDADARVVVAQDYMAAMLAIELVTDLLKGADNLAAG